MRVLLATLVATITIGHFHALAQQVFWLESTYGTPRMWRANTEGSARVSVPLPPGSLPQAIALDGSCGRIYWTSRKFSGAHIFEGNTELGGIDSLVGTGSAYRGIALDIAGGKLYWTSTNLVEGNMIRRANFSGSGEETLCVYPSGGRESLRGIALDIRDGKMYSADFGRGRIMRTNLDGGDQQDLLTGLQGPVGVALDSVNQKLYWTEANGGSIKRSSLDGDSVETLLTNVPGVQYISLDTRAGMMYWTEIGAGGVGRIKKATLDGGNPATIAGSTPSDPISFPQGIAILDTTMLTGVAESSLPVAIALVQNYPNPFNPTTAISYQLSAASRTTIVIYDLTGREVVTLVDGLKDAGSYSVVWDASKNASGIYFCRMVAGTYTATKKMVLMK
jgi:hypothetical protein